MRQQRTHALVFFQSGIYSLQMAAICWSWFQYKTETAILVTVANLIISGMLIFYVRMIPRLFAIPCDATYTGDIDVTHVYDYRPLREAGRTHRDTLDIK